MFFRMALVCLYMSFFSVTTVAADPQTGPVIKDFGPVFDVPAGAYNLAANTSYKVSMDVSATADFSSDLNRHFVSAARFLNMHSRNGIDPGNIEFAIIVHGAAARDLLNDEAYKVRFDEPNPNTALLGQLSQAGVKIYLCGQSAVYRGFLIEDLNPIVIMSLSAMTAHVRLQAEGFTLIPF